MTAALQGYDLERADFARVVAAVRSIREASDAQLASLDWLLAVIRSVGLVPIPEAALTYEGEEEHLNASQQGVIQLPREFARWLQLVAEHRPARYLEIGTFNGATASLAAAYLARFHPDFSARTIDVWPGFVFHREVRDLIPLRYEVGRTSFDLRGERFDAVFIDGDHSFDWAWADYENVGRGAPVCAFHDVNNAPYRELPMGGVCGVWALVQREERAPGVEFTEIFEHPSRELLGIGVRVRR
jgi:hypothetical protein